MEKTQSTEPVRAKDLVAGTDIRALFLIGAASQQQARNGPFWRLELKDATATLEGRIWSPNSQLYADIPAGRIAEIEGRADSFRERIQVNVTSLRLLSEDEMARIDISAFLPASARPAQEMFDELLLLCKTTFTHKPWRKFILGVLEDEDIHPRLMVAPAAKAVHHAWVGGLLEHTLGVARLCMALCDLYPSLDRQTLLAGAVCHDLGKLWEMSGGLENTYTDEGLLIGHLVLVLEKLERRLAKSGLEPGLALHFRHLILSHHGQYEFASPRLPQTPEALALHQADNLDAKLTQCATVFASEIKEETGWSSYQRPLERSLYKAARTPDETPKKDESAKPESRLNQCSLL